MPRDIAPINTKGFKHIRSSRHEALGIFKVLRGSVARSRGALKLEADIVRRADEGDRGPPCLPDGGFQPRPLPSVKTTSIAFPVFQHMQADASTRRRAPGHVGRSDEAHQRALEILD
jgi:hypothetical protein